MTTRTHRNIEIGRRILLVLVSTALVGTALLSTGCATGTPASRAAYVPKVYEHPPPDWAREKIEGYLIEAFDGTLSLQGCQGVQAPTAEKWTGTCYYKMAGSLTRNRWTVALFTVEHGKRVKYGLEGKLARILRGE